MNVRDVTLWSSHQWLLECDFECVGLCKTQMVAVMEMKMTATVGQILEAVSVHFISFVVYEDSVFRNHPSFLEANPGLCDQYLSSFSGLDFAVSE